MGQGWQGQDVRVHWLESFQAWSDQINGEDRQAGGNGEGSTVDVAPQSPRTQHPNEGRSITAHSRHVWKSHTHGRQWCRANADGLTRRKYTPDRGRSFVVEEEFIIALPVIAQRWNMFAHHQRLTEASAYVQRAASREWQEFMGALDAYVEQTMHNMVTAPMETLQQEQGRAQAVADLRKILRDAPKVMEKIEASKQNPRHNSKPNKGIDHAEIR